MFSAVSSRFWDTEIALELATMPQLQVQGRMSNRVQMLVGAW